MSTYSLKIVPQLSAKHYDMCAWANRGDEPLEQLPPHYLIYPEKPHCKIPHFDFGIGVRYERLCSYALQHRLVPHRYQRLTDTRPQMDMLHAAVKHLNRISGANLYLQSVLYGDDSWIVARYSNYTWHHEGAEDWQEDMVMDLIRRELNIDGMPRWYRNIAVTI